MNTNLLSLLIKDFKFISLCSSNFTRLSKMSTNVTDVREEKNKLRLQIKNKLKEMSEEDKLKQTYIITRRLIKQPDFQRAERIAIYVNMKNEVGTFDILREALNGKKQVFIPLVVGDDMKMVKLNSMEELTSMPKTNWGIIQPLESDRREDCLETGGVHLVVVPGVAFTSSGLRLGHGRGYYDKFLAKNNNLRAGQCVNVGVAFDQQVVADLPTTDHDVRLTRVVHPDGSSQSSKYDETPSEFSPPPVPFAI